MKTALLVMMTFIWCLAGAQTYDIVLVTDFDGKVTSGSKQALIKYIREGKPVRVGWQLDFDKDKVADFDHWIEASFITILGEEVFTQIDPIYAQGPNTAIPQIEIYSDNTRWTAVIGTNGKLLNRFVLNGAKKPEPIFDEALGISKEEFENQKEELLKNREAMNAVKTWEVATFWSIAK